MNIVRRVNDTEVEAVYIAHIIVVVGYTSKHQHRILINDSGMRTPLRRRIFCCNLMPSRLFYT